MKVKLISLGCPKNQVDLDFMQNLIKQSGITVVDDISDANTVVINSCCFIQDAILECESYLEDAAELKSNGKIERIYLSGCYPQYLKESTIDKYPYIDGFITPDQLSSIVELLSTQNIQHQYSLPTFINQELVIPNDRKKFAYVKIAEGCNHNCRFCIIPQLRGKHRSRNQEIILTEISELVSKHDKKEIILISQDSTFYGRDFKNENISLLTLLQSITQIPGDFRVRLLYLYPTRVDKQLIEFIAANQPRFYPYFDLPIQHFSKNVLKKMGRGENLDNIRELPNTFRKLIPNAALRCTLLVGFPGETEQDFEELCEFVEESRFDRLGVFPYSNIKGISSFDDTDQVPSEIAQNRADTIMLLQSEISEIQNKKLIGTQIEFLIEKRYKTSVLGNNWPQELIDIDINPIDYYIPKDHYLYIGRCYRDAPEIDGIIIATSKRRIEIGQFRRCHISKSTTHDLWGSINI